MPPSSASPAAPSNTMTTGANAQSPTTQTASAAGKIDFVDTVLFSGCALALDILIGIIPGVAYVCSPLIITGFQGLFWLKGITLSKESMILMGGTASAEAIPVVSEILPGITTFVLTRCLLCMFEGKVKEQLGGQGAQIATTVALAAATGGAGAAVGGAAAAGGGVAGTASVGAGAVGAGATQVAGQGAAASGSAASAATKGGFSRQSFNGALSRVRGGGGVVNAVDEEDGDDTQQDKFSWRASGDGLSESQENAYAPGSPLVEGQPQAVPGQSEFMKRRQAQVARERRGASRAA